LEFGALPIILAVAEIFLLVAKRPFWKDRARREANLLRGVLALTDRDDYVLDCRGETVFRRRCFRPVFETITRRSIERGLIADDAPQRSIETRTCVVATTLMNQFSHRTRQFIKRIYLPVTDSLRVADVPLKNSADLRRFDFEIVTLRPTKSFRIAILYLAPWMELRLTVADFSERGRTRSSRHRQKTI
jgi:hypothetical protein